jgi:general secretion pathway protein L
MTTLVIFLDEIYPSRWLRLDSDRVVSRGDDLAAVPRDSADPLDVVAVVSGVTTVIHWVELPALAPAQAAAAAQLLASDVCGSAIAETHVALGPIASDGTRPLALVEKTVMKNWLAALAEANLIANRIVPMPLLLPLPLAGGDIEATPAALLNLGTIGHARGPGFAISGEVALVEIMLAGRAVIEIEANAFETGLSTALASDMLNLCQGEFAPSRELTIDRRRLRRIGMTALAAAGVWLATEVTLVIRDTFAAERVEQQVADAARAVLPRGTAIDAPRAQVAARSDRLGAGGHGFTALAVPLLEAMRDRSDLVLQSLRYTPDTGIAAVIVAPSASDRQALASEVDSGGQVLTIGDPRDEAGVTVVDIAVRPK